MLLSDNNWLWHAVQEINIYAHSEITITYLNTMTSKFKKQVDWYISDIKALIGGIVNKELQPFPNIKDYSTTRWATHILFLTRFWYR
jgi:hypothetical protein